MECTQRLECTQELYDKHTERTCPEQIGFLGICGGKKPVVKGPNKIGRDPQTCNIILNLNSISRHHAVINVLNGKEFMLMDLDSANKTKLQNKILEPYIPHPLRDGDTVQFGDIFGVFRLLEEDDTLPMTQAIDIPETPVVAHKHVTKLHKAPTTVIPESPDVSDRDESFITPSQPQGGRSRLSSSSFIKPNNNQKQTIAGSSPKKYSNCKSSKLSTSLSFTDNRTSLNESFISLKCKKNVTDNIHEADTQAPNPIANDSTDSIYTADTQIPFERGISPSIHGLDTQVPSREHLPEVRKIDGQHEMQLDIFAANKENNRDIFNAETQPFGYGNQSTDGANKNDSNVTNKTVSNNSGEGKTKEKLNTSEEALLFDDVDGDIEEYFHSQNILQDDLPVKENATEQSITAGIRIVSDRTTDREEIEEDMLLTQKIPELPSKENEQTKIETKNDPKSSKRIARAKTDSSTDCEDIDMAKIKTVLNNSGEAKTKEKLNTSEEALLFDDVDVKIEEYFHSQNILQDDLPFKENATEQSKTAGNGIVYDGTRDHEEMEEDMLLTQKIPELPSKENEQQTKIETKNDPKCSKRIARAKSDSSTDCEDIDMMPTQIIPVLRTTKDTVTKKSDKKSKTKPSKRLNRILSDSSTDCEDIDLLPTQKIPEKKVNEDDDVTDCEDDDFEIKISKPPTFDLIQDDIPTQIIIPHNSNDLPLEDQPTQIIGSCDNETNSKNVPLEDQLTQVIAPVVVPENIKNVKIISDEIISPFKIPFQSPIRVKSKDIPKLTPKDKTDENKSIDVDDNYYNATQDIYADLCSQIEKSDDGTVVASNVNDEVVPYSVEGYKVKDMFANIERESSPARNHNVLDNKDDGGSASVAKLKKVPSDSSDIENTPKKVKKFVFTDSDLPDSQEIKTSMMSHTRSAVTESSSESEPENYSEEITPFLKRKKKTKPIPKVDLNKMFDKLPERVITRQRKPTFKLLSSGEVGKNNSTILKPSYLTGQEDQIDGDIISENIKRLKTFGKEKTNKDTKNQENTKEEKKQSSSRTKTENKSREPKEKIKVKIERPKRNTKSKTESSARKHAESEKDNTKNDSLDSTSSSKRPTRRTRAKKNQNDTQNTEKKSVSPENSKKEPENKRKLASKKQEKERSVSPELEVRRSTRQQKVKEKHDDTMKAPKSIPKNSIHEQSTVYNISTSSSESPKNLKRSLVDDSEVPNSKRTRSQNNNNDGINNASLRATPARAVKTHHVLLTAFPSVEVKEKLEKLGAVMVTDVMECSVVLTKEIKRTFKLLCAVGLGRPIVGPSWVQACADTHIIVDPWLYLVKDEQAEKRFQFSLQKSLTGRRGFLKGYNVSSTPSVQPNAAEMKLIVECSGGTWKEGGPAWVCVSCFKDTALWPALRKRGATVVSTEFILGGVLRQKLEIDKNKFP